MARLDEYLTAPEFEALEQIGEGGSWPVKQELSDRLLELGYIEQTREGMAITSKGQMRLALGRS
jgi:hypothetical protein